MMRWLGGTKVWIRGGILGLAVTTALLYGLLEQPELQALNGQFHLRGPRPPGTPSFFTKEDLNPPLKLIRDHAVGFGAVNFAIDDDAFVRSAPLTLPHQGIEIPSFDLQLYRLGVKAGIPAAPLPVGQTVLVNYRGGPRTFPSVPFYRVINGEVPPEAFRGKIVLVGATSPILQDIFPTPFAPKRTMPGVEIHANMLETLFQGIESVDSSRLAS